MCGRYTLAIKRGTELKFADMPDLVYQTPRYNVGPGQTVPVITGEDWEQARFGLVPQWAKSMNTGYTMINARAETLTEKRTYAGALKDHRCLVPATGFYEWEKTPEGKQPYYFTVKNQPLMIFAGLWTSRKDSEGHEMKSFAIITTEANELVGKIHDRMPVILSEEKAEQWLIRDGKDTDGLLELLSPLPADHMESIRVSTEVNKVSNDSPELINSI